MTNDDLTELLSRLLTSWENEVVEFKEASGQFSAEKTAEYVSALSNEANLRGHDAGWLVFGVANSREVVGTAHLADDRQRHSLKRHVHQSIDQRLTIREVYEVVYSGKRVVLLEVPAAPQGIRFHGREITGHGLERAPSLCRWTSLTRFGNKPST